MTVSKKAVVSLTEKCKKFCLTLTGAEMRVLLSFTPSAFHPELKAAIDRFKKEQRKKS